MTKKYTAPSGAKATLTELEEFVEGWADKINMPADWIRTNLKWAEGILETKKGRKREW